MGRGVPPRPKDGFPGYHSRCHQRYDSQQVKSTGRTVPVLVTSEYEMGDVWAGLYVLGFLFPGLILLGSVLVVLRLARRLRELDPNARPRWQYVALHVALGMALVLPLGPAAIAAWLVVPMYLYRVIRRAEEPGTLPMPRSMSVGRSTRRRWSLAVFFTLSGVLLPWSIGLVVKMYLDARGRPTLPLEGFLDPASIMIELLLTLGAWAFPFLLLASAVAVPWRIGFAVDSLARDSLLPIWLAYAAGALAAVPVFVAIFRDFDSMMLLAPVGMLLLPPMALGYFLGWWRLRVTGRTAPRSGADLPR